MSQSSRKYSPFIAVRWQKRHSTSAGNIQNWDSILTWWRMLRCSMTSVSSDAMRQELNALVKSLTSATDVSELECCARMQSYSDFQRMKSNLSQGFASDILVPD